MATIEPGPAVVAKKPVQKKKPAPQYVTKSEFEALTGAVSSLVDLVKSSMATKPETPAEAKVTKAVEKAAARMAPIPEEWQEMADEILGENVDHVEVMHLRGGGTIFTVVIRKEKSNAPKEYLSMYGSDRRSKEIGTEGIEGVEQWCKLIRDNLKRPRQ